MHATGHSFKVGTLTMKKGPDGPFSNQCWRSALGDFPDVRRLQALRALHDVELDLLTLRKATETLGHDRSVVHEHVGRPVASNEAKPLCVVEPLHGAFFHRHDFLAENSRVRLGAGPPPLERPAEAGGAGRAPESLPRIALALSALAKKKSSRVTKRPTGTAPACARWAGA